MQRHHYMNLTSLKRGRYRDQNHNASRLLAPSIPILCSKNFALSLYGVWNMDFFRPFYSGLCFETGVLPTLSLDYAIAVYPIIPNLFNIILFNVINAHYVT